jgi:hypothetical protein
MLVLAPLRQINPVGAAHPGPRQHHPALTALKAQRSGGIPSTWTRNT